MRQIAVLLRHGRGGLLPLLLCSLLAAPAQSQPADAAAPVVAADETAEPAQSPAKPPTQLPSAPRQAGDTHPPTAAADSATPAAPAETLPADIIEKHGGDDAATSAVGGVNEEQSNRHSDLPAQSEVGSTLVAPVPVREAGPVSDLSAPVAADPQAASEPATTPVTPTREAPGKTAPASRPGPAPDAAAEPAPTQPASGESPTSGDPLKARPAKTEPGPAAATGPASDGAPDTDTPPETPAATGQQDLELLGNRVPPGTSTRLAWSPSESFAGITVPTPVLVVNGVEPGPTLCLTAAIHGDELTGIEIVRRVMFGLNAQKLRGAVIGVPIVNLQGFRRNSRYLPDRRDLNRYFPGVPNGSLAARVAHSFFQEVATKCDAIVDMHTGSFHRTNLPQVRADMNHSGVATLARNLGAIVVLQSRGNAGTLRRAAVEHGIPAVTLEAGEPMRLVESHVAHGVQSIQSLLNGMQMSGHTSLWGQPEPIYYKSVWVRSNSGGILFSRVKLGDRVRKGDILGTVTDPITNARSEVASPLDGRIIGMALNQVVMPGFAAYHIGVQTTEEHAAEPVAGVEPDEAGEIDEDAPGSAETGSKPAVKAGSIEAENEAPPFEERDEPDVLENS